MTKHKMLPSLYLTSLGIENVRCFGKNQRLDLTGTNGRPARWTLILGENGVGKTTLLQCLAWMHVVPEPPPGSSDLPVEDNLLGAALMDWQKNEMFDSLLRVGSGTEIRLNAQLAVGTMLVPASGKAMASKAVKAIRVGVKLIFDKDGLKTLDYDSDRVTIKEAFGEGFPNPLMVAYGANRKLGEKNLQEPALDAPLLNSRLEGMTDLYDIEELLVKLDHASLRDDAESSERLARLRTVIARVLPEPKLRPEDLHIYPPDVLGRRKPSGPYMKTPYGEVRMSALSLGYRTTLAWTADLAWRLTNYYKKSSNPLAEPAIVLIDEIDSHLHPHWQLSIMDDLSLIFPGTQFVATAHSPLLVQVAQTANLVLLSRRETDVEIVSKPDVVRNWRVDQILNSKLFGIRPTRNEDSERLFAQKAALLRKASRTKADEKQLGRLRARIAKLPTAATAEDQEAMDFIREAAAILKKRKLSEQ